MIYRVIVAPKGKEADGFYTIYNLETNGEVDIGRLNRFFCNPEKETILESMPAGKFHEVMYHNGVIDPDQIPIIRGCKANGVEVEAVKVGRRYYGDKIRGVVISKLVHIVFTHEPELKTLKPRGNRRGMQVFDLTVMSDLELVKLSKDREVGLSLAQMKKLVEIQKRRGLPVVNDVFIETFGAKWSDHCNHITWKSLGLFIILKAATDAIKNSNLVSAFIDNAGGWKLWEGLVAVFKLETHNSPTATWPYGGQLTKLGGVIRDILAFGLGAVCIGSLELTAVGEFLRVRYPQLDKFTLSAGTIGRETIRAIRDYGNQMGIPMLLARMLSHPCFAGKPFALGGCLGITTRKASKKGTPRPGDLLVIMGGRTGNDGLHGATLSSGAMNETIDQGDSCHGQIGEAFTEQKMMAVVNDLRFIKCLRAKTDCGAAGILMGASELGESVNKIGGVLLNLACVLLKCAGLEDWQILLSESQERNVLAIIPKMWPLYKELCDDYQVEVSVVGIFTGNGNFQVIYDPEVTEFTLNMPLSGEICLDQPYSDFEDCPLPVIEVIEPPKRTQTIEVPIDISNVAQMAVKVVSHFDLCNQAPATTQYDYCVGGKTRRGPLYGQNYNIPTHLAAVLAKYGRPFGVTVSWSFSPWQFESDPVKAAANAMVDAIGTQVISGVKLTDVCLSDNFYTPNMDKYAFWYLIEQVKTIADLSIVLRTPFIVGKDSSSGSSKYKQWLVNVVVSVVITAMGRHHDLSKLVPHEWQQPGNLLFAVGKQFERLDGSILASALNITGHQLESLDKEAAGRQLRNMEKLAQSGLLKSATPINRGGIIQRLFEGVEGSGFGVKTDLCKELFPESMGSALVEVSPKDAITLCRKFRELAPLEVGQISGKKGILIGEQPLPWKVMRQGWNTTFRREIKR